MKKKLISLILIVNIIICYNTMIYATGYESSTSSSSGYGSQSTSSSSSEQSVSDPVLNPNSHGTTGNTGLVGGPYGQQPEEGEGLPTPYGQQPEVGEGDEDENESGTGAATGSLGNPDVSASHTPDEIIGEANSFLEKGNAVTTIDGENLKQASSTLYNILLSIGILLAVGIGMYLGVKFMVSTAEDKAKVKEAMIPYIAGCIVIFSAFVIWKAAILLFGGIG